MIVKIIYTLTFYEEHEIENNMCACYFIKILLIVLNTRSRLEHRILIMQEIHYFLSVVFLKSNLSKIPPLYATYVV